MTTNEPDGAPATTKPARERRVATPPAESLPVERVADPAAETDSGADPGLALDAPPEIAEDGSWVEADAVEIHQAAVGRVDATDVAVTQGAIGAARGDRVSVEMGALGVAMGGDVSVSQGFAGTIVAQRARVEQSLVRTLIAQEVEFRRPSGVLILLAQRVSGDVKVLLDWRGALAFGAAFGLVARLFGRGRRGR